MKVETGVWKISVETEKQRKASPQEKRQRAVSKQKEGKTLYPIIQSTLRNAVDIVMFFEVQTF